MTLATVDSYTISLFLHVSAVVVGFGATFAEALMFPVALRAGDQYLPYVHRLQLAINRYMATPALVVIILTGSYQVADAELSFGDFWIGATFLIAVILGGMNGAYFIPSDRKLGPMVARDLAETGVPSQKYLDEANLQGRVGAVAGVLVLIAIFLMVTKPGA